MANDDLFKKVVSHAKEYGYIFASSEIYDGLSAVYDYAQNGVELKKNIREYCGLVKLSGLRKARERLPAYQSTYPFRRRVLRNVTFRVADSNLHSTAIRSLRRKFSKAWDYA